MTGAPHIVRGWQSSCPCGAHIEIGTCADGLPGVAHALPTCDRFAELDPTAYLMWLYSARMSMPNAAALAKMERAYALGREPL